MPILKLNAANRINIKVGIIVEAIIVAGILQGFYKVIYLSYSNTDFLIYNKFPLMLLISKGFYFYIKAPYNYLFHT